MINVTITSNLGRTYANPDEHETIKSVLDANDIGYSTGMISLDGATLRPGDINKTFADMGVTEKCFLSVVVKADNASDEVSGDDAVQAARSEAAIIIAGSVVTMKSAFTPEELKLVGKFRPAALTIFETEDGHKVPKFSIGVSSVGNGSVSVAGVSYANRTAADGKAMMVMEIPEGVTDVKKWAADKIGVAILKVRQIEAGIDAVLTEIKGEQSKVADAITII